MIVQKENPVLRKIAREVDFTEIAPKKLQKIVHDMTVALDSQDDGVAIAAPQIGLSLRIFVVSNRVFEMTQKKQTALNSDGNMVCINPVIIKASKQRKMMEEGCLSVRWLYGQVSRSAKVTLEAYDEQGKKFQVGASGLLAQVFQHETDHLNGILFIDTAENLEDIPPEKQEEKQTEKKVDKKTDEK